MRPPAFVPASFTYDSPPHPPAAPAPATTAAAAVTECCQRQMYRRPARDFDNQSYRSIYPQISIPAEGSLPYPLIYLYFVYIYICVFRYILNTCELLQLNDNLNNYLIYLITYYTDIALFHSLSTTFRYIYIYILHFMLISYFYILYIIVNFYVMILNFAV